MGYGMNGMQLMDVIFGRTIREVGKCHCLLQGPQILVARF